MVLLLSLSSDMHELLRNATYVNTCSTKAPSVACGAWAHIVEDGDFQAKSFSFCCAADAASASTNHDQIVFSILIER